MKAIFIAFDQSYTERIIDLLTTSNCRGFSMVEQLQGRGSVKGEPHYGNHAWPSMCSGIITMVDDDMCSGIITMVDDNKVDIVLEKLHAMDVATEKLGLRAFVWNIEKSI